MEAIKYAFNEALKPMRDEMNAKFDAVNERLDRIEEDVTSMKEDIEQLKEDSEITRGATNEIIEWIDVYFREQNKTNKKYKPISKQLLVLTITAIVIKQMIIYQFYNLDIMPIKARYS